MNPTFVHFRRFFLAIPAALLLCGGAIRGDDSAVKNQVVASEFGYDAQDATDAIQTAIDSGAARVVIDKRETPWIVSKTIRLKGDQEVVFEDGVVVLAKAGAFLGGGDALFLAQNVANLTLRGKATLRMRKEDYWKPPYKKAEWRHALSLRGCTNVRVLGLTLKESGGDGIYLGTGSGGATNKDIVIKDVVCDGNNRQGISVITAENLLIEDTVLKNTRGTPPAAGIDFEPNRPSERLVNCVMRNCVVEGNAYAAYAFYLRFMDETSAPVSIRIENCVSRNNEGPSVALGMFTRHDGGCLEGKIEFVDCRFEKDKGGGIVIRDNDAEGVHLLFRDCLIRDVGLSEEKKETAPILLTCATLSSYGAGNITFENVTVVDPLDRPVFDFGAISPTAGLEKVGGTLIRESGDRTETLVLDEALLDEWFPMRRFARDFAKRDWRWTKPASAESTGEPGPFPRLRGSFRLAAYAEGGTEAAVLMLPQEVGRGEIGENRVRVTGPDGKEVRAAWRKEGDRKLRLTFNAEESGVYTIDCRPESTGFSLRIVGANVPVSLVAGSEGLKMIYPVVTLFFVVPAETECFAVGLAGAGAERVKGTLIDAEGNVVETRDDISTPTAFLVEPETPPAETTVWRLKLEKPSQGVLEDVSVALTGVPPLFAPTPQMLLAPLP